MVAIATPHHPTTRKLVLTLSGGRQVLQRELASGDEQAKPESGRKEAGLVSHGPDQEARSTNVHHHLDTIKAP